MLKAIEDELLTMSNVSQELAALIMFTNLKYTLSNGKGSLWLLGQVKGFEKWRLQV